MPSRSQRKVRLLIGTGLYGTQEFNYNAMYDTVMAVTVQKLKADIK